MLFRSTVTGAAGAEGGAQGDGAPVLEERLLATRGQQAVFLRPLLLAGMLCASLYLWVASVFAWHFEATLLIPGATAVDSVHDLTLQYELARPVDGALTPQLRVGLGNESMAAPVAPPMTVQIAGVEVAARGVGVELLRQRLDVLGLYP